MFTIVSEEQCATARAPYLSDAEHRQWLALLPERPYKPAPEVASSDLLASLSAGATMRPDASQLTSDTPTIPETAVVGTGASELPFSVGEGAVIAARIARGETKTEGVRRMPG